MTENQMTENRTRSAKSWMTAGLVLALCAVNLLLINQNVDLRRQIADRGRRPAGTVNSLKVGDVVASLAGTDLNGQPYQLEYKKDGRHRVLMFFSPSCPYCIQQAPLWRELLDKVDSSRFTVLGVVGDKEDRLAVSAHAERLGYFKTKTPLPIAFFSDTSLERYKLTATPTTLLIDEDGKVEHTWVGKWDETKATEVASALK